MTGGAEGTPELREREEYQVTDYRIRAGEAIAFARNSVGKSQQELANLLGRDKRTVQKWEKGEIRVTIEDFCAALNVLNLPDELYFHWVCHPELFPNGVEDLKKLGPDGKREALVEYYARQASPVEVEQAYYVLFSDHGSNYFGMRQQQIANLQTPLRDRKRICAQIIENYNDAKAAHTLTDPEGPQPIMEVLAACYGASVVSVERGDNRYSIGGVGAAPEKKENGSEP